MSAAPEISQLQPDLRGEAWIIVRNILKIGRSLLYFLAGEMVRQRPGFFGRIAKVQQHQYLLIVRKTERIVQLVDVNTVQPAGLHPGILRAQHQVRGDYRCVFYAGLAFPVRVGIYVGLVECNYENRRGAISARCAGVYTGKSLRRLADVDMLFLKVLRSRGQAPRLQYCIKLFTAYLPVPII